MEDNRNRFQTVPEIMSYIVGFYIRLIAVIVYFTIGLVYSLLSRVVYDPLKIRRPPETSAWASRKPFPSDISTAKREY